MLQSGVTGIAYETVEDASGRLPLLEPMSEVAGRMAAQVVSHYLERHKGGRGVLMGGVPRRGIRERGYPGRGNRRRQRCKSRSGHGCARNAVGH